MGVLIVLLAVAALVLLVVARTIRIVPLKAIDPTASIQESMEKQMRADREKRATVLKEGVKQAQILEAEGEKQSPILRAEGDRQAQIVRAEGQAKAIETVFGAIHAGDADPKVLAYQYLQTLPQIARGESNKLWLITSDYSHALERFQEQLANGDANGKAPIPVAANDRVG
jgi:regulator of protease activity HflC (stomatin/prohibitin superfamily)